MSGTGHQPHSPAASAPSGTSRRAGAYDLKIDELVIDDFFNWPRHQAFETLKTPRIVGLLYGLLCVDISGREVLLPNADGVADATGDHGDHGGRGGHGGHGGHGGQTVHRARIWFQTSTVDRDKNGEQFDVRDEALEETRAYTYFDITSARVEFTVVDAKGNELPNYSPAFATRNSDQHPWMNFKWVRCLKRLTGLPLIGEAQRNDPNLVSARIRLESGNVAAIPPFSRDGQHNEWYVKQRNGVEVVSATTDSMLWSKPLHEDAAKVLMTITPFLGGPPRTVLLTPYRGAVLCAVTHATTEREQDATRLVHSKVYAKLLQGGDTASFPVPVLVGTARPEKKKSSQEVHCECASCP